MKRGRRRKEKSGVRKNGEEKEKKAAEKKRTPSGIEARTLCVSVEASSYNH